MWLCCGLPMSVRENVTESSYSVLDMGVKAIIEGWQFGISYFIVAFIQPNSYCGILVLS